jgi:holo-[acyl-carrier protein] synthase
MSKKAVAAPLDLSSPSLRVGIDLVKVSRIAESLERFGDRFLKRVFTPDESAYAVSAPALTAQRLAARFAAKESAFKALRLTHVGVRWTDLEVRRSELGDCSLVLHGAAKIHAEANGIAETALSMSHEDDCAIAIVIAR